MKRQAGFSVIELLAVMVIMGIVASIALPNLLEWSRGLKYREASRNLVSVFRNARAQAVAENREYQVLIDVDGSGTVTPPGGASIDVPRYGYVIQRGSLASNTSAYGAWTILQYAGQDGHPLVTDTGPNASIQLMATTSCDKSDDQVFQFNPNGTSSSRYVCIGESPVWMRRFIVGIPNPGSGRVVVSR